MSEKDAEADWPLPRANPLLLGQEAAEAELLAAVASGRLPHAWLIGGQSGVGKATLAFRFARFLFAQRQAAEGSLGISLRRFRCSGGSPRAAMPIS